MMEVYFVRCWVYGPADVEAKGRPITYYFT